MALDLGDALELLLAGKSVRIAGVPQQKKNSLRTMILAKFKNYCRNMEAVGFLDESLQNKTVAFKYTREQQELLAELATARETPTYYILEEPDAR